MKNYNKIIVVLIAAALVNLIAMLCVIPGLPESIPVHFNYRFEVDRMGSPWFLAAIPAVTLAVSAGILIEQKIRGRDYANNKQLTIFACGFVSLFIVLGWMLYAMSGTGAQMGDTTNVPFDLVIGLGMSILSIIIGNYLPTVKQNRTFGIRIKATFESEEVWRRVHRFGGLLLVLGGILSAICTLIGYFTGAKWLIMAGIFAGILGASLVTLIYAKRVSREMNG